LIEEFSEVQKNNDYIILTTFCFDPYFFDKYLFHKIRANNPEAEVLVLIDGEQYTQSLEKFTTETGRSYHLIPIYVDRGVFHPKVSLFVSKRKKEATIYVASSNLTLPGFTRNAEIVAKIKYNSNYSDKNVYLIQNFFITLINKKYIRDAKSIMMVKTAFESFLTENEIKEDIDYEFIHNLDNSILSEMMKLVDPSSTYEAILLAPFFAQDESVIKKLRDHITIDNVSIGLPKNRHNLNNPSEYIKYFTDNNINYNFYNAVYLPDESRIFHSKLIYLKGKMQYLLVGSPNITSSALLRNGEVGNIECAIFLKRVNSVSFFENIDLIKIKNFVGLNDLKIDEPRLEFSSNTLRVYSVEFDDIERTLKLIIEPIRGKLSICIIKDNGEELFNKYYEDELKLKISSGIPEEVIISSEDKTARFRVYYDRNYFIRNLPRNKESFKQIIDKLSNDFTIGLYDIRAMIIGLARRNQELTEKSIIDEDMKNAKIKKDSRLQIKPGKTQNPSSIISEIHGINRIYQSLCFNIRQRQDYQDTNMDEESDMSEEPSIELSLDQSEELDVFRYKFINSINKVLIQSVNLSEEENKKEILVQVQSIFLDFILKSYNIDLKEQHFELIEYTLENNLKNISQDDISQDSSIKLFMRLLSMNYCYNQRMHNQFMSEIFYYRDLINFDTYYYIKNYVLNYQRNYCVNSLFNLKEFQDQFCSLITFIFRPANIVQGSMDLIHAVLGIEDEEFIDFIGLILIKLKYGPWDQKKGSGRISLVYPRKRIEAMKIDISTLHPKKSEYIIEFLTESLQRKR